MQNCDLPCAKTKHRGRPQRLGSWQTSQLHTKFPEAFVLQPDLEVSLFDGPDEALALDALLASEGELPPEGPLLDAPPLEAPPPEAPPPDAPLAPELARAMLTVMTVGTV